MSLSNPPEARKVHDPQASHVLVGETHVNIGALDGQVMLAAVLLGDELPDLIQRDPPGSVGKKPAKGFQAGVQLLELLVNGMLFGDVGIEGGQGTPKFSQACRRVWKMKFVVVGVDDLLEKLLF